MDNRESTAFLVYAGSVDVVHNRFYHNGRRLMIELPFLSLDMIENMIENFTIIATLVLLYNFIPDTLISRSKQAFSLSVGIVFGLAAIISIPAFWHMAKVSTVGFNFILVPLSGFIGGPVSSVFVAAVLLTGSAASSGSISITDTLTIMSGILLGALFYIARSWTRFPKSSFSRLSLLGIGIAFIETGVFVFSFALQAPPDLQFDIFSLVSILPFVIVSWAGTIILGTIINYIDRSKQAEKELLDYKNHLERLVDERTVELKQANSLQKATIESTADGLVVVSRDGLIRAYNQRASRILDLPRHLPVNKMDYGAFTEKIVPFLLEPDEFLRRIIPLPESAEQVVMTDLMFTNGGIYELYVHPQQIGDSIIGRVWSFHDISKKRQAEETIAAANNKLVLLSNITRHDILNQMTALFSHLELLGMKNQDPTAIAHVNAMRKSLDAIQEQLEFTRDYQDLGLKIPEWQDAGAAFIRAAESFAGKNITFSCETAHVEILADPMIGQVFYNLIDNSIRHGDHVSEIRLLVKKKEPDLLLVYEDNGNGVLPEEKEKIFLKGFGKHTGLGMFLIKEILSITGIVIRENGIWQQGARFEMCVPPGKFRFP